MQTRFREGQLVRLIGGEQQMRVVKYETKIDYKPKNAFGFPEKPRDTGILTGKVQCVWVDLRTNSQVYDSFAESDLEACE